MNEKAKNDFLDIVEMRMEKISGTDVKDVEEI